MVVLGLDSAARCGYALVKREAGREIRVASGVLDLRDETKRARAIEAFAAGVTAEHDIDLVGIEDNWLNTEPGKANVATVKALSRMVGRLEQAFEGRGKATMLIQPQSWATGVLGGALMGGRAAKRDARKTACKLWVRATYGVTVTEDEADAIAIATWVARRESLAERIRAAG